MSSSTSTVLCHYRYDPLDRLASTQPAAQDNAMRFYRKNRLATQIQGAIRHTFFGHDDQLLAQQQHSGKRTEARLLATDQQGSVLHGVDMEGTGSRAYNAYGHHPAESGLSCLMGFNGEQRDPVTGHYLLGNGYRAFNPVLLRFNSPDELSPFGQGGLNAYAYCQGDPINFRDSTGRMPLSPIRVISGLDELLDSAARIPVSKDMDDFIQSMVTPANVTVSRPVSAPVAQASTSQAAMQAGPSMPVNAINDRKSLLDGIAAKELTKRELRRAHVRIYEVAKSGALEGLLAANLGGSKNRFRALVNSDSFHLSRLGHYKAMFTSPNRRFEHSDSYLHGMINKYLDKLIISRKAIVKYREKMWGAEGQSVRLS